MFKKKRNQKLVPKTFDRETQIPVLRASICTGEQVMGFKDKHTGKFEDVMLIRGAEDLAAFCESYGITGQEIKKEW